jgi:anthranilate phosphoribosyltransferase
VLKNEGTQAQTEAVVANSAMAIRTARPGTSYVEAVAAARESLESGAAFSSFQTYLTLAQ